MRIAIITLAALAAFATPAIAHPSGHHDEEEMPASPEQVARNAVISLITQAKLPASWSSSEVVDVRERTVNNASQIVVTFSNETESRAGDRLLYVVVDEDGRVVSARHTPD